MRIGAVVGGWIPGSMLLLPVLATVLHAQADPAGQAARVPTVGRILDRAGKPWSGAKVVLLSRLHPICNEESVQRVQTTADARGKFRVELDRDRVYLAWGHSPVADGKKGRRLTSVATGVLPGQVLRLQETESRGDLRLRLVDQRGVKGRLGARLVTHRAGFGRLDRSDVSEGMGFEFGLQVEDDGTAGLPAIPWREVWLEILDDRGVRIQIERLSLFDPWPGGLKTITVHGIDGVEVTATPSGGLPAIRGLVLFQRVRGRLREVQRGDSDVLHVGLRIPQRMLSTSRGELEYPDLELGTEGSSRALLLNLLQGKGGIGLGSSKVVFPLTPGRVLRGRTSQPRCLVLQQDPQGRPGAFAGTQAPSPVYEMQSDAQGRFADTGLGTGAYRLLALLTEAEREALRGEASIEPQTLLALGNLQKDRDLGLLDPTQLVRVDVAARFSDGRQAVGARILLMQPDNPSGWHAVILRSQGDRKGRRRLLLPAGGRFDLLIASERGHAIAPLDLRQAAPGSVLSKAITVPVGIPIRGIVKSPAGEPIAGARLNWVVRTQSYRASVLAQRVAPDLCMARSDAKGRFGILAPLESGKLLLFVRDPHNQASALERLQVDGEPIEGLEVTVPGK